MHHAGTRLLPHRRRRLNSPATLWSLGLMAILSLMVAGGPHAGAAPPFPGADSDGGADPVVAFDTAWSATGGEVGEPIVLAVVMDIAEGYSVTSHRARQPAIPLEIEVTEASEGLGISSAIFPDPHMKQVGPDRLSVVDGRTIIHIPMQVRAGEAGEMLRATVEVAWQACDDEICLLPEVTTLDVELPVVEPGTAESAHAELFDGFDAGAGGLLNIPFFGWDFNIDPRQLWLLLLVAAIGGFLLNLTPCVLPLIPIKIMGLSQAAGSRGRTFALGLVMFSGVLAFWILLGALIALASGFTAANQLFQYPAFTIGVGIVIAIMAVGMCGLFAVRLPQWVYRLNPSQESVHGSFGFGLMIAVLSTPCTAPFMGAAAAWAAGQSPALTLSTFAAIGIGMALPYLVLSAFPQLTHRMPKVGAASELIKQVMGLFMLAAAAYFIGTGLSGALATPPDPPSRVYWWAVGLLIALAGGWLAWRTFRIAARPKARAVFMSLGLLVVFAGVAVGARFGQESPVDWIYYTPERFEQAQQRGDVIVLEFTAEWCLNCKWYERTVLFQPDVVQRLNAEGVSPIKVDITGNNPAGNARLAELGRQMIPFLVIYDGHGEPVLRTDAYTVAQVVDALDRAVAATAEDPAETARLE